MTIIRLLLLLFLGLLVRRVYRTVKASLAAVGGRGGPTGVAQDGHPSVANPEVKDLTEQDISDADFEEIP